MSSTTSIYTAVTAAALAWFAAWEEAEYPARPADAPAETEDEFQALCDAMYAAGAALIAAPAEGHADVAAQLVYWVLDNEDIGEVPGDTKFARIVENARQIVAPALREPIARLDLVMAMQERVWYLPRNDPWEHNRAFFRRAGGLRNTPTGELRRELERLQKRTKGRRRRRPAGCGGKLVSRG